MLRGLLKTGLAGVFHRTGAERLIGALTGGRSLPLVIGYHMVVEDIAAHAGRAIPANLISRRTLEHHLDWLGRRYCFLSLDELGTRLEHGDPFDKPTAAITFDDGYADVYHHAFPLLRRKGIPAGIFVVTDLVGTAQLQVYDKLYLLLTRWCSRRPAASHDLARLLGHLQIRIFDGNGTHAVGHDPFTAMRALFTTLPQSEMHRVIEALKAHVDMEERELRELHALTWEMVAEMHRAGMTIGSHTRTHALLTNEPRERVLEETAESRRTLEQKLGTPVLHFAYPDGRFNAATVNSVAASGYRFGYTTCLHRNSLYPLLTIPRTFLWENSCLNARGQFSSSIMGCQAHRVFDLLAGCSQHHGRPAADQPTPAGGPRS